MTTTLRARAWRGWKLGLAQRDTFVLAGTALLVVQLGAIGMLLTRSVRGGNTRSASTFSLDRIAPAAPQRVTLQTRRGTLGWISEFSTDLSPEPAYNRRSRRLAAYLPVRITGVTGDLQYVRVETTVQGRRVTGFVQHAHVQLDDPTAAMVPEAGQVTVTRPGGADLRDGPSLDATVVRHVARGGTLTVSGRIRRPEFMRGVSGDFLRVTGTGPPTWLFAGNATDVRE